MDFLKTIGFILVYLVVGAIISAVYTYLAGWNLIGFIITAIISPGLGYVIFFYPPKDEDDPAGDTSAHIEMPPDDGVWPEILYFFLPIILNGVSLLLKKIGWEESSHLVYILRYYSLLIIPTIILGGGCGVAWLQGYFARRRLSFPTKLKRGYTGCD